MTKTTILLATGAAMLLSGTAFAADVKSVSSSIVSVEGLPEKAYTSASVVAYGEPPKEKVESKRRFEVGFVPSVPPPPNMEKAMVDDKDMGPAMDAADGKGEMTDEPSGEKTASVTGGESAPAASGGGAVVEINTEGMELRTE